MRQQPQAQVGTEGILLAVAGWFWLSLLPAEMGAKDKMALMVLVVTVDGEQVLSDVAEYLLREQVTSGAVRALALLEDAVGVVEQWAIVPRAHTMVVPVLAFLEMLHLMGGTAWALEVLKVAAMV